jgi:hypothetical protein
MQTRITKIDENRPLQKRYTQAGTRPVSGKECEQLCRNAMDLNPGLPAANLVAEIIALAEPEYLSDLDQMLRARFFIRTVKALRARDHREEAAQLWLYPEIQKQVMQLPEAVPIGRGKTVERAKVIYKDLTRYLKILNKEDRERHQKRIAAVKALMKLWPTRTKNTQGRTLQEVDVAKARSAGLIE